MFGFIGLVDETGDFPFGFAVTEEATVFLLALRSPETDELPVDSIGMSF